MRLAGKSVYRAFCQPHYIFIKSEYLFNISQNDHIGLRRSALKTISRVIGHRESKTPHKQKFGLWEPGKEQKGREEHYSPFFGRRKHKKGSSAISRRAAFVLKYNSLFLYALIFFRKFGVPFSHSFFSFLKDLRRCAVQN